MTKTAIAVPLVCAGDPVSAAVPDDAPVLFPLAGGQGAETELAALRRSGARVEVAEPVEVEPAQLAAAERAAGVAAVSALREDPDLVPWLRLSQWVEGPSSRRLRDRTLRALHRPGISAYWAGVRQAATESEWLWLTCGYAVLLYHRLAGESSPGQERLDVPPRVFDHQVRSLRLFGFRFATVGELEAFHYDRRPLPPRSVVLTVDDATADVVPVLARHAAAHPLLFVVTRAGERADWLGGTPLAAPRELEELARDGVTIGAHSRTHPDLTVLDDDELHDEVGGSVADVAVRLGAGRAAFAYPNGLFNARVRNAVARSGCMLAFSTWPGLNGVAADPLALRRISVKAWDGAASVGWKAALGSPVPEVFDRWRTTRHAMIRRLPRRVSRAA